MKPSLATRKPVEDLSANDLEVFPVWEFAEDEEGSPEQDETWVRPRASSEIPENASSICVRASVRLACGLIYPAALFVDTFGTFTVQAVGLLTIDGRVLLAESEATAQPSKELRRLGLTAGEVFPLEYSTIASLAATGQVARGTVGHEDAP